MILNTGNFYRFFLAFTLACGVAGTAGALEDDRGRSLAPLPAATRIVSLAPHATELVIALGAADRLVAVDPHSDAPGLDAKLPRVAAYPNPDPEKLLALRPDLVLVWGEGLSAVMLARLEAMGFRVFVSQPRQLEDVAISLERMGALLGRGEAASELAQRYRGRLEAITSRYASRTQLPIFVQIWEMPLITIGAGTFMDDALARCGTRNLARGLSGASPRVAMESVLAMKPALIVSTVSSADDSRWRRAGLVGDSPGNARFIRFVDPVLERPSPAALDALERLCAEIDNRRTR